MLEEQFDKAQKIRTKIRRIDLLQNELRKLVNTYLGDIKYLEVRRDSYSSGTHVKLDWFEDYRENKEYIKNHFSPNLKNFLKGEIENLEKEKEKLEKKFGEV